MSKTLSEMTLEELWELFPIFLTEHKENWHIWYGEEEKRICAFLPHMDDMHITHIGSTAIAGIWAKPIVDILLEVPKSVSMEDIKRCLIENGYLCMSEEENRKSFNRGYTSKGFAERVFHLHLRYLGDNREIFFKEYLNQNTEMAKAYETLKLSLWKKYEHDRDAYTEAKSDFCNKIYEKQSTK